MKILMGSIPTLQTVQNTTNVPMALPSFNPVLQVCFGMQAQNIVTGQQMYHAKNGNIFENKSIQIIDLRQIRSLRCN